MEGAGESVVAIFQGTKHSGLMVTLAPDNRFRFKRKCVLMDLGVRPPTRITQSSVETNTERVFKNASEPMCDIRFASRYQFENCKSVQSSLRVSEYPLRSTLYRPSDQFADSLRKYPVQASSEIIQRIINYSNIKQNGRKQNLRNIRSSCTKSASPQKNRRFESGVNTNSYIYEKKPKNRWISAIGSRHSSQKELQNYTYDYLKCISLIPRCRDVRYLTQIKRCIRNRLLDIFDDRPAICPRIRSRYSHHKKQFHNPVSTMTIISNKNETQESIGCKKLTHKIYSNDSHSKLKKCHFHQPKKCNCKPKANIQNPLESFMRKLYPELNEPKKEIPLKKIVSEPKIQTTPEDFPNNLHDGADDEIMRAVSEWLKLIPVYPNFNPNDKMKQDELAYRLAEKLSSLKNNEDFISKAKREIMSCVNDLPMWYPHNLNEREQFFDEIVADLLKRLVNVLDKDLRCKVARVISNLSYTEDHDVEKDLDDFVYKIKTIERPKDERTYVQALKPRIMDFLSKLPVQSNKEKIHDVADNLVNQLFEHQFGKSLDEELTDVDDNQFKENILKWCETVPELDDIHLAQNLDLIDELANKFKHFKSRGPTDESLPNELVKAIRVWLEDAADTENIRLNSKTKNRISNKMADHFFGKDYNNAFNKRKSSEISTSEEALRPLLKWYQSIQELEGGNRVGPSKALDRLEKELTEIQSRDYDFDNLLTDMKDVVTDWLQNMLIKRGKHLEPKVLDNYVNKLILDLHKRHWLYNGYGQFYRDVVSWIKNISYLKPESHLQQNILIQKFVQKLNNIPKRFDNEFKIIAAITDFIQSLSENLAVRIHERDIQTLKDKILDRLKYTPKERKRWDKGNDLYQNILPEISSILQEYTTILGDRKINNLKEKIYKHFLENVKENGSPNWNYLLRQINNIFKQETNLQKNDCNDLSNSIIERMQNMFPQETTRSSTVLSQPVKADVEPTRVFGRNIDTPIKYKTQKDSYGSESDYDKNKSKKPHYRKKNLQTGDGRKYRQNSKMSTIYKSSNSDVDTRDSVDYYEMSENQTDRSAFNKHEEIRTSTPLSAGIQNFPTPLGVESPISNITENTKKTLSRDSANTKQLQYSREVKNFVRDWFKNIDLTINTLDLKEIVDDIASEIVERQKYLQLSELKPSENDELEHLKYQIFRKLNKLKKIGSLPQILTKINSIYSFINNISVPDLTKPANESNTPATSVNDNSTYNKISHWLDSVSSDLLKSSNVKNNPALINKLAVNLEKLKNNNQDEYQKEKDTLLWLQSVLKNCNDKMFHELAEDLKSKLNENSPETSKTLKQGTSEFIDENIFKAIVRWLQTAEFYKSCTPEERYLQEKLGLLLTTNLINILQATKNEANNLNNLLVEEVQNYLKSIPMATEFRYNMFYYKTAGELVEYLKQSITKIKEMCDGVIDIATTYTQTNNPNDVITHKDLVKNIIQNWCENLPINLGNSSESKEQAEKIKCNIAVGLSELTNKKNNETNNDIATENMLSDEIHKLFNNVPMNQELDRNLPILISILIEKLKQAKTQTQSLNSKEILRDTLTKTLQDIENTPDQGQASFNLLKKNLADAFINLHYQTTNDYEFRDKMKDKLYNVINKFCNEYLERHPSTPINSDDLRFNLYGTLKKVSLPDMQHLDVSDPTPHFLTSTLNIEDQAHLEIIRQRAADSPETPHSKRTYNSLYLPHKEVGVQTDYNKKVEENVQTSQTNSYTKEIIPQVVIKEFYWDSSRSNDGMQMFVPATLTPHFISRNKETNNFQNQTDTNDINNSTKVHVSPKPKSPNTRVMSNNKVDKASEANSQNNNEKQGHFTKTYLNSPAQKSQNNHILISPKDSVHRQQQTERPFYLNNRKRDTYPGKGFDNGVSERYWIDQPRPFQDERYIRKNHKQSSFIEDLSEIPYDRRVLTRRIFLTPENINKKNMCCDLKTNWRMGGCRPRCNNTLKHCSKCCSEFCPHPTYEFFKKGF